MDILIQIGVLIIGLLVLAAMAALLVAIVRLLSRSGIFEAGATNQSINRHFIKALFFQDILKQDGKVSPRSAIWRAVISFIVVISMGLAAFFYLAPQMGINS